MSEDNSPKKPSEVFLGWSPHFDAAWKLGLLISVLLYTIGLVISNVNAQQYGRYNLGLNKADYIIVGLLWTGLAGLGYIMFRLIRTTHNDLISKRSEVPKWKHYVGYPLGMGLVILICSFVFGLVGVILRIGDDFYAKPILVLFAVVVGTGLTVDLLVNQLRAIRELGQWNESNLFVGLFLFMKYGMWLPLAVMVYIGIGFPLIPSAFGGGGLQGAELFIKLEGRQFFKDTQVALHENGSIGVWGVVAELSDAFVVTNEKAFQRGKGKTIWIRKDRIEALSYTNPAPSILPKQPQP